MGVVSQLLMVAWIIGGAGGPLRVVRDPSWSSRRRLVSTHADTITDDPLPRPPGHPCLPNTLTSRAWLPTMTLPPTRHKSCLVPPPHHAPSSSRALVTTTSCSPAPPLMSYLPFTLPFCLIWHPSVTHSLAWNITMPKNLFSSHHAI